MKYKVGDIVKTIIPLEDEQANVLPVGTSLRIVAIAPKVFISKIEDGYHDRKKDFFNAVRTEQESDYGLRIRANFCTITKEK
jgi:hypothetical protein